MKKLKLRMSAETIRSLRTLSLEEPAAGVILEAGTIFRTKCVQWWCTDVSFCAVC